MRLKVKVLSCPCTDYISDPDDTFAPLLIARKPQSNSLTMYYLAL